MGFTLPPAAKMIVIGVTTNVSAESLREAGAEITIAGIADPALASLLAR